MAGQRSEGWSLGDVEVLARAVLRAPSVHNLQPWTLEVGEGGLLLRERRDLALPEHDPRGRDRLMSCGAALANLELAVRVLGRQVNTRIFPDPRQPELVAALRAGAARPPEAAELHRYSAIARRRSYRHRFSTPRVSDYALAEIMNSVGGSRVQARSVTEERELSEVADLLEFAAEAYQHDQGYQRELALWTIHDEYSHRHGAGIAGSCLPPSTLPWAGLVRPSTALPDHAVLRRRLGEETLLVFVTVDDAPIDHLRAGAALENAWLTAVDGGLAASVLTQPLHLPEVRSALCEKLGLAGFPQVLMRVGHASADVAQSPRRAIDEILRDHGDRWLRSPGPPGTFACRAGTSASFPVAVPVRR
ncbi:Acg family FMN-binding oxidoreductase [Amycolatopsis samaneae]|uniref:Acg family FMN-binding oxidoreductase n=1 Tax=Amycolatopsis samaneae TaxID=664691 RepID=A0ABW5GX78_9PSEU